MIDCEEVESRTAKGRGRPCLPILKQLTQPCYYVQSETNNSDDDESNSDSESESDEDGRKLRFRCVGVTKSGGRCPTSWGSRAQSRILKHAKDCSNLIPELRALASDASAKNSLVPELEKAIRYEGAKPPTKRIRLDVARASDANQTKLDCVAVPTDARVELQNRLDAAILILICTSGIPPTVADSAEWKTAWLLATKHKYRPPSSNVLAEDLIPSEAARIQKQMITLLQSDSIDFATIGFDGGATVGRDSFTTVHATTSDRHAFFLDAECTTGLAHTGEHYADTLDAVS